MLLLLLMLFTAPVVEMYLLIRVGGYIGALPTVGLVLLTAVIGVALLRWQGLATLTRGMRRLDAGLVPARELVEGLLLAVAGVMLLAPGFVTDTLGFLLLVPPLRAQVASRLLARARVVTPGNGPVVIDGQFESRDESPGDAGAAPRPPDRLDQDR
jgi:UPF0716 protein FxsA